MQYKTIVLELLEQRTELYAQLRKTRQLLPTMEALATELRDRHMVLTASLTQAHPGSDPSQIPSQALELACKELEDRLPFASHQDETEALSLDKAMAHILSHTSRD